MSRFRSAGNKSRTQLWRPLLAAALLCGAAHAEIYRIIDGDSPVVYTNVRPMFGRFEVIQGTLGSTPAGNYSYRYSAGSAAFNTARNAAQYAEHIEAAAAANHIDPALIRAVISAESGYNPDAVSRKGAVGLMQLMPETARRYNVTDSRDPAQNIHGGARYLSDLLQMFDNDPRLAVAAYNAGEQAVIKYGNRIPPYRETMDYVPKVLRYYERDRGGLAPVAALYDSYVIPKGKINYRYATSSAAGTVSYQTVATPKTGSQTRAAAAVKKNNVNARPGVMYLSNAP